MVEKPNIAANTTNYLQHYPARFRYLDSKEHENTTSNNKQMLMRSCLFNSNFRNTKGIENMPSKQVKSSYEGREI